MLFKAILVNALLVVVAVALPSSRERLEQRVAMRNGGVRNSRPLQHNITHDVISTNWAGAVLNSPAGTYQTVVGTIVVPGTPKPPPGASSGFYSSSAWVGIDGVSCGTAILQTGIDITWNNGTISYNPWFEWFPNSAIDFKNFEVAAGDTLTFAVNATSLTTGTASINNHRTHLKDTATFSSAPAPLCQKDAEWIVEDYDLGGEKVPFVDFGTVTFTSAQASGTAVGTVGLSGAKAWEMEMNNKVVTSVSIGSSSVEISYV